MVFRDFVNHLLDARLDREYRLAQFRMVQWLERRRHAFLLDRVELFFVGLGSRGQPESGNGFVHDSLPVRVVLHHVAFEEADGLRRRRRGEPDQERVEIFE